MARGDENERLITELLSTQSCHRRTPSGGWLGNTPTLSSTSRLPSSCSLQTSRPSRILANNNHSAFLLSFQNRKFGSPYVLVGFHCLSQHGHIECQSMASGQHPSEDTAYHEENPKAKAVRLDNTLPYSSTKSLLVPAARLTRSRCHSP